MDSSNESCAKLSETVSTSSNVINTRELEDLFYDDGDKCNIRFSPPVYIQRYQAVINVLTSPTYEGKIRKVVDFGCSELGFFIYLKNSKVFEQILCVDVDEFTLECHKKKIDALTADYLHMRDFPLTASIYKGSVTDRDKNLENTDAVVCIELIEHLYDDTLAEVPENIFGYIKPRVAIMTTPNADFNVLFRGMKGFRHYDHKFEWTRQQFENWANEIVNKYSDYEVSFQGIGSGPEGTEDLGCCSQMAIFHRRTDFVIKPPGIKGFFKLISQEYYPVRIDNRSDEDKILDEVSYCIRSYQVSNNVDIIPLKTLASMIQNLKIDDLKEILVNSGYEINENEEGTVIICRPLSVISEDDSLYDEEDDFDYENDMNEVDDNYDDDLFDYNDFNSTSEIEIMDLDNEVFMHDVANFSSIGEHTEELEYDELATESLNSWDWDNEHEINRDIILPNSEEVRSMCSIFIERSQNENSLVCPENITNPSFELSTTIASVNTEQRNEDKNDESLINTYNANFQQTSTPRKKLKLQLEHSEKEHRPLENSQPIVHDFLESPSSSSALGTENAEYSHALSMLNTEPISDIQNIAQKISDSESARVEKSPGVDLLTNIESQSRDLLKNNNNKDNNLTNNTSEISEKDIMNKNIR